MGTSWISRKGGVDLEKKGGGDDPPLPTMTLVRNGIGRLLQHHKSGVIFGEKK